MASVPVHLICSTTEQNVWYGRNTPYKASVGIVIMDKVYTVVYSVTPESIKHTYCVQTILALLISDSTY